MLAALGGTVIATSLRGERSISADAFFRSLFITALEPDEILTRVTLPRYRAGWRWAFREVARQRGAFALVLVTAGAHLDGDGRVSEVRVAVGGCDSRPVVPEMDWGFLVGSHPHPEGLDTAAEQVSRGLEPHGDPQLSADDRRQLAKALVRRALAEATGRSPAELAS